MRLILADRKAEYFSQQIWTGVIDLKARLKLVFRRRGFAAESDRGGGTRDDDRAHLCPTGKSRCIGCVDV
jgi:hypothetical protein